MKKLLAMVALLALASPALAEDLRATEADAQALAKNAATYLKRHGPEKAFKEFANKNGPFVYRDLYVVALDLNGNVVAHGADPSKVGGNDMNLKDPDGKFYARERIEAARTATEGSQQFKRKNPATGVIELRTFFWERVGDVVLGSGCFAPIQK